MKTVLKWLIGTVVVLGLGVGLFFGVGYVLDEQMADDPKEPEAEDKQSDEKEEEKKVTELSEEKFENAENAENLNPFGDDLEAKALDDTQVQDYIHEMSHQKVEADEKWGFYLITDERIKWLQQGIEASKDNLSHYDVYQSILNRWAAGDFTQADDDHNAIWDLKGGTIGYATGVLSDEEEQAYIESADEY
ncbi:DUF6241 domain-containing protein [Piscibacillus salipiscarius]|uniref:DUF6241 domain-containing protein n=1 Tax=Piscibacillus salipiscarius TaxID=299480 RepID=A0ABW5QAT0_9BACI